jgi:hypothetical protein
MLNKKSFWSVLLVSYLLVIASANADSLEDFVTSKLDGKGTVDNINVDSKSIVINDRSYVLSNTVTVFDVNKRKNTSIENVKVGDSVGFKSKALAEPTAPFDQLIEKIWIMSGKN